jgi:hypothetical protein
MADATAELGTAASELTHALTGLVRALDAFGDDGEAASHLPEGLAHALEELSARVSAATGFTGG